MLSINAQLILPGDKSRAEANGLRMTIVETLRRPLPVAMGTIVVLTFIGWTVLLAEALARGGGVDAFMEALCTPAELLGAASLGEAMQRMALSIGIWIAMSVAMMLPTASLLIVGFADRVETLRAQGAPAASPIALAAGYLLVWAVVSALAAVAQTGMSMAVAGMAIPDSFLTILAGMVIGGAGFYQFSGLKRVCLITIRHPFAPGADDMFTNNDSAFRLGLAQGMHCVGCCWALMGVLVVVGAMNIVWMAVLAAIMAAEKMSASERLPRLIGLSLIAAGAALSVSAIGLQPLLESFRG